MNEFLGINAGQLLIWGQFVVLVYFLVVNGWYMLLLVSSLLEMRRHLLLIAD
jgi:hypothetical protein